MAFPVLFSIRSGVTNLLRMHNNHEVIQNQGLLRQPFGSPHCLLKNEFVYPLTSGSHTSISF
jgi:hypothetical protein